MKEFTRYVDKTFDNVLNDFINVVDSVFDTNRRLLMDTLTSSFINSSPFTFSRLATTSTYNLKKLGEEDYELELPAPGFTENDLEITYNGGYLSVKGKKESENSNEYVYSGVKTEFAHSFFIGDNVSIEDAVLEHGMLKVRMKKIIPDYLKPKIIPIHRKIENNIESKTEDLKTTENTT